MSKILAYGTLREGDYNFERVKSHFGETSIQKVRSVEISGFSMHNLGFFPGINRTNNTEDKILCDILEVSDKAASFIEAMELGAGYETQDVEVGDESFPIYIYRGDLSNRPKVETGDWFKQKERIN